MIRHFGFSFKMIGLILIIIASTNGVRSKNCSDTELCPFDKPFCSEVGCISECPAPFYINGNNCVSDCGEMFVDEDRNCISECPEGTFYKETLKQTICKPYLERKCLKCGRHGMFISNDSCVNVCPSGLRYIDGNNCVSQCPEERPFKINTTIHGSFFTGIVCLETCEPGTFSLNKTCVNTCTGTHKKFHFNGTCIEKCPESYHNIAVLIEDKVQTYPGDWEDNIIFNSCTKDCGDEYFQFNGSCVNFCKPPLLTFERTCVTECPRNATFYMESSVSFNNTSKESASGVFKIQEVTTNILRCVKKLPLGAVLLGSKVVGTCPSDSPYIVDWSCQSNECSKQAYKLKNYLGIHCVVACPSNMFVLNTTCVSTCYHHQAVFNQRCVDFCPSTHAISNQRIIAENQFNCFGSKRIIAKNQFNCFGTLRIIVEKQLNRFGGKCVIPDLIYPECRANCPPEKFLINNECKSICPNNTVIHDNMCVKVCPPTHQKVEKTLFMISRGHWLNNNTMYFINNDSEYLSQCVSQCSWMHPLQFRNWCLSKCPDNFPYKLNSMCVEACPENKLNNLTTNMCVDQCEKTDGEFNRSCHNRCPKHIKYIFNAKCVSKCPSSHPVALEKDRFVCSLCDDPMFEYNGLCLHRCPNGFVWLGGCRYTLVPKIFVSILCTLLVLLTVLNRQFFLDFKRTARLVFLSMEMIEEEEKQLIQSESNKKLKDKKRGEEDVIPLHELLPHIGDEHIV